MSAAGAASRREERTIGGRSPLLRVLGGDLGSSRVIAMLAAILLIFQLANDRFLSAINLTNLMLQITAVGMISTGAVLVLLLGEIDLWVAAVSGLAAGVVAVLNVKQGWAPLPALLAGLAAGAAVGAINGLFVTRVGCRRSSSRSQA